MADTQSEQGRRLQQPQLSPDAGTGSQPTHLDLFSGIGGFALAAKWAGFRTVAFCELDKYCQKVLAKNFMADAMRDAEQEQGHEGNSELPERQTRVVFIGQSPPRIHSDIFALPGGAYRGVDLITGGFPCQPFSVAGKRRGAADDRAIWPQMFRVISEARPAFVLGENVPGLTTMVEHDVFPEVECDGSAKGEVGATFDRTGRGYLNEILESLEAIGYDVVPFVIPACAVDARHRRDRLWIVGRRIHPHSEHDGLSAPESRLGAQGSTERKNELQQSTGQDSVCHTAEQGLPNGRSAPMGNARRTEQELERSDSGDWCRWLPESDVGRVAHGIPKRVDRLKGLGNSIVPQVAYELLREIRKQL